MPDAEKTRLLRVSESISQEFKEEVYRKYPERVVTQGNGRLPIIYWDGTDSENRWEETSTQFPGDPTTLYYQQEPIEYKLNSNGFRTPHDLDENTPGNLFLGCSHTSGVGHHLRNTWSWKMHNYIGGGRYAFYNLAMGGTGFMYAYRIFMHYISKLKVKNVFFYGLYDYRYEFYSISGEQWKEFTLWSEDVPDKMQPLLFNEYTSFLLNTALLKAIAHECNHRGIPFYFSCEDPDADDSGILARDRQHFNIDAQDHIYTMFRDLYSAKNTWK